MDSDGKLGAKNVIVKLPRHADLINKLYVCIDLPGIGKKAEGDEPYYQDFAGYGLIESASLWLGSQQVECLDGRYLKLHHLLHDFTMQDEMVLNFDSEYERKVNSKQAQRAYVPLPFSFIEQGAVMAAIQHQEVEVRLTFKRLKEVIAHASNAKVRESIAVIGKDRQGKQSESDGLATGEDVDHPDVSDVQMLMSCVYLDEAERAYFQNDYEQTVLISQVQPPMVRDMKSSKQIELSLPFNNPCRDLVWVCRGLDMDAEAEFYPDPVANVQFRVNNNPRFFANDGKPVEGRFFRTVTLDHYPIRDHIVDDEFLYAYSFDAKPSSRQAGASLNMGKIDHCIFSAELDGSYTVGEFLLFARSWNAVEYSQGKANLKYAN